MAFSASEAAFEGFRIIRREPVSVLIWSAARAVISGLSLIAIISLVGPTMVDLTGQAPPQAGANSLATLAKAARLEAVAIPLALFSYAVFSCAVYRAVLRPDDEGLGRLRFGADELRMIGLFVLLGLLFLGGGVVAAVVLGLFLVLLIGFGAATAAHAPSGGAGAIAVTLVVTFYLVALLMMAWIGVRLSLAAPMTFAQRRLRLFQSWRLTKGRFWSLLGCYVLSFTFILILSLVSLSIYGLIGVSGGGSLTAVVTGMFRPDYSSIQAYFTPARALYLLSSSFFAAGIYSVGLAPAAAAYRDIAGAGPEVQAHAFD